MALRITFAEARALVSKERVLLHAWATKRPFTFGAICIAVTAIARHFV